MTKRPLRNVAASVRDRLLNRSRETGEDFQFLLQRYAAERLLFAWDSPRTATVRSQGRHAVRALGRIGLPAHPRPRFHWLRSLVYVTTHLAGAKTRFLPFNQGRFGGAGNPPVPPTRTGYATAYLWEETWARDSVLDLIRQFIQEVEEEDEQGRKTGKRFLIFPRYQQLDCVRKLVADARANGAGQRYLIEHSAGSGKSFTIAWLAHRLSTLHDASDRRVFDSIVVITDRRVLDRQLQATMRQFEQTLGVVENIDTTSRQLKDALEQGKTIIVTTLQKFPVIAKEIGELPGKRFAVIIDEAHSSQSGESTKSLKAVLASGSLEEAEREEERRETPEEELENIDPRRDGEARPSAEPLHLRLYRDAEAQDAGTVRQTARRTANSSRSTSTACARRSRRGSSSTCWPITPPTRRIGGC